MDSNEFRSPLERRRVRPLAHPFRGRLSRCRGRSGGAGNDRGSCACSTVATRSPVARRTCRRPCTGRSAKLARFVIEVGDGAHASTKGATAGVAGLIAYADENDRPLGCFLRLAATSGARRGEPRSHRPHRGPSELFGISVRARPFEIRRSARANRARFCLATGSMRVQRGRAAALPRGVFSRVHVTVGRGEQGCEVQAPRFSGCDTDTRSNGSRP
jgi:hypothetical protein